jgi:DNA-binding NarL/FixJ family response regulator
MARVRRPIMQQADATELWQALESGRASVVDRLDRDRRRYVLVRENADRARAMTERERQIVERASRGDSNKAIAFDLGIATSTVSTHLSHAAAKLGLDSRNAVIQTYSALAGDPAMTDVAVTRARWSGRRFVVIAIAVEPRLPAWLSPAERDVAARAVAGESNAGIARARGVSARTIEHQLASAMRKLGVRSRAEMTARVMRSQDG